MQAAATTSRAELARRHRRLGQVSPEVGSLDREAFGRLVAQDPDAGVAMLVDLARATDAALRRLARALAPELLLALVRVERRQSAPGVARLAPTRDASAELDVDATVESLAASPFTLAANSSAGVVPAGSGSPSPQRKPLALRTNDLSFRTWRRAARAYVLVVDASGSVTGTPPLSCAVVTAAALADRVRPPEEIAVVAFWSVAVLLRPVASREPPSAVIDSLLSLRGGDTTDLAAGLRLGIAQAGAARAPARDLVVLTDGMANAGSDPLAVAATAPAAGARVHVLSLSREEEAVAACRNLASAGGGRAALLLRPSDAPAALSELLD